MSWIGLWTYCSTAVQKFQDDGFLAKLKNTWSKLQHKFQEHRAESFLQMSGVRLRMLWFRSLQSYDYESMWEGEAFACYGNQHKNTSYNL